MATKNTKQKDDTPTLNIITPKGVAIWPRLNKPDEEYNVYKCRLRLDPDDAEVSALVDKLTKLRDKYHKQVVADLTARGKANSVKNVIVRDVFAQDLDDKENETGLIVLSAKTKASGTYADGKAWKRKPVIFDAKGSKLKDPPLIYGGSELKLACLAKPYSMQIDSESKGKTVKKLAIGVTLYLNAAQVIKLVSGGGPQDAEGFGFREEDGYEAADETFGSEGAEESDADSAGDSDDF